LAKERVNENHLYVKETRNYLIDIILGTTMYTNEVTEDQLDSG